MRGGARIGRPVHLPAECLQTNVRRERATQGSAAVDKKSLSERDICANVTAARAKHIQLAEALVRSATVL